MKRYLLLIIAIITLASCTARKKVEQNQPINTHEVISNNKVFFDSILKKHDFETLKISSQIDADLGRSTPTLDATFYIENNKKVWANLQAFFITVARALATPSGIKAFEKINKTYVDSDFTYINKLLNVNFIDYNALQNLLLGKIFVPVSEANYALTQNASGFNLENINPEKVTINNKVNEYKITLNYSSDYLLKQVNIQNINNTDNLQVNYDNYENMEGKFFPKNVKIIIKGQKNGQILIENTKFEFSKMETPFSIPTNYTKTEIK